MSNVARSALEYVDWEMLSIFFAVNPAVKTLNTKMMMRAIQMAWIIVLKVGC